MTFWLGWLCGLGAVCLHRWLWGRLYSRRQGKAPPKGGKGGFLTKTQEAWAQTRNFLYYDGTPMPEIKTYKEEVDE